MEPIDKNHVYGQNTNILITIYNQFHYVDGG